MKYIKANTLTERGFPYSLIKQFCHMEGSPFFQRKKKGTWWCEESKLNKWLDKMAEAKNNEE